MADYVVSSGVVSSGLSVASGTIKVLESGLALYSDLYIRGGMYILPGGRASNTVIHSSGSATVSSGGIMSNTSVSFGGKLSVDSGGTALAVKEEGGFVSCYNGAAVEFQPSVFSNINYEGNRSATVHSGTTATNISLISAGNLLVYDGGLASNTSLNIRGFLHIYSGGEARDTNIYSSGRVDVYSSAVASGVKVSSDAYLCIESMGTALAVKEEGGFVSCYKGGVVEFLPSVFSDSIYSGSHSATVHSGTTATNISLISAGDLLVYDGGLASNTNLNVRGFLHIYSGGEARDTNIYSSGRVDVYSSAVASGVKVSSDAYLCIESGGTALAVREEGGFVSCYKGAAVVFLPSVFSNIEFEGSHSASVHSGTTASNISLISAGDLLVYDGGLASNTNLNFRGYLHIYSGGEARDTNIFSSGRLDVLSGGVARNIIVSSAASISIASAGKLTGQMEILGGANVSAAVGAIIDFDISSLNSPAEARLNDLSLVKGKPVYTLTVSGSQADGTYVLANGAADFDKTITVVSNSGIELGTLLVGETRTIGDRDYTLNLTGSSLSITVEESGSNIFTGDLVDETKDITAGMCASSVNIYSSGILNISRGGVAEETAVYSEGEFNVFIGGFAKNTQIYSDGGLSVHSGGSAENTTVYDAGDFYVSEGGVATYTTIAADGGFMCVRSGGRAIFTVAEYSMVVDEDAFVSCTTVKGCAVMQLNGSALDTTISSGGTARITLGFASATTILDGGLMLVESRGVAQSGTIAGGVMNVLEGTANSMTVESGGVLIVSGGTATLVDVASGGFVVVSDGGVNGLNLIGGNADVKGTVQVGMISGGTLQIADFGSAVELYVMDGEVNVAEHGYFNGTITGNGVVRVGSAVEIYNTTVMDGGRITGMIQVSRGNLVFGAGGVLDFDITTLDSNSGALVTNYSLISGTPECTLTVSDSQANGTFMLATSASGFDRTITVKSAAGTTIGTLTVDGALDYSGKSYTLALMGGTLLAVTVTDSIFTGDLIDETKDITLGLRASSVNILSGGILNVYARGVAEVTTLNSSGVFNVYQGGVASRTVVNSCGSMFVSNGGVVFETVIHDTGALCVSSGGVALSTTITSDGGYMCVSSGGSALHTVAEYSLSVVEGAYVSDTTVKDHGVMLMNGSAFDTMISSGGTALVTFGIASDTTILEGGLMTIESSGLAYGGTVAGAMVVAEGAVHSMTVESGGVLKIIGGEATLVEVNDGGSVVVDGGTVNGLSLVDGTADVNGTIQVGTIGVDGTLRFADYGSGTELYVAGGEVYMADHGYFNGTITGLGMVRVGSAVELYNTTVMDGGRITGMIQVSRGNLVFGAGGILDFDISALSPENEPLVTNYSLIYGTPTLTLTISDAYDPANGTYFLASDVTDFDQAITVVNTAGDALGTISVGRMVSIGGKDYTLSLNDIATGSTLALTVSGGEPGPEPPTTDYLFFTGDFNGDGSAMLAVETPEAPGALPGSVTIYMNGEPWGLGVSLDYGWEVVDTGDFNGDGLDDFLRVNGDGYVVGEMSNGNGTFSPQVLNLKNAGWDILGTGDFNGNGTDDVLIANPTGASEVVGLLGYWESGVTWTLINGYSPEWECVSTGDFNGDGKCDMLWRNSFEGEGGLTYNAYCTWIMDDPVDWRMVSVANPDEWNFLCSGDFDGNGSHDIAMINDVGVVGIWGVNDGYLNSWSILSAVNPAEWTLAGVADFNGDGTDDIAWCNIDTGMTGYWQINDKELTAWANIATIS